MDTFISILLQVPVGLLGHAKVSVGSEFFQRRCMYCSDLSSYENIKIFNGCVVRIEKFRHEGNCFRHHEACQVMPNSYSV